ncbi:phosphatidylethanolamine N-methyltransferase isoform X1 [Gadus morhua]|uniref:phosphatidylethanolamine N-methyltransferase isoform X1 n=2 Tax=Gadus morhua TaxID=8049 RepID=UPI0011B604E2|nr:phosphatidylethanolamine N-methyltransferase isoform X1 [Gadus morhua]XP_059893179.1 phosphatidylethanolamine N-methyltransferase isoform X1 [Gadus macrocephalus]
MSVSDTLANDNHVVLDCCGGLSNLDYSKVDMSLLGEVVRHVDVSDPRFCVAVLAVLFNPFFWNVVARWEHRTRGLSRLFRSPSLACYCLGVLIILLNVYRSHSMAVVMKAQPRWELLDRVEVFYAGAVLMAAGGLLVLTSFLSLGFTGTFLGDYFGILMDEPVTGFPFSLTENPMYWGSSATYLGLALIGASPVGLVLTAVVFLSYAVAIAFEGPFTQQIYRERSQRCKHK